MGVGARNVCCALEPPAATVLPSLAGAPSSSFQPPASETRAGVHGHPRLRSPLSARPQSSRISTIRFCSYSRSVLILLTYALEVSAGLAACCEHLQCILRAGSCTANTSMKAQKRGDATSNITKSGMHSAAYLRPLTWSAAHACSKRQAKSDSK